jgi:ribonuclease P protein component
VGRITTRSGFDALRSRGVSARSGPVRAVWVPPADAPQSASAAFSVPKRAGSAVTRNRIRRRLRAALIQLRRDGELAAGSYLLHGSPELAELPWTALLHHVRVATARAATGGLPRR